VRLERYGQTPNMASPWLRKRSDFPALALLTMWKTALNVSHRKGISDDLVSRVSAHTSTFSVHNTGPGSSCWRGSWAILRNCVVLHGVIWCFPRADFLVLSLPQYMLMYTYIHVEN
jgi:hypothetical protein